MIALLLPSLRDLAGWAGVAFAALVFIGLGRLLARGRAAPEIALAAGWGAACVVLTLWGVATPLSLRLPAAILALGGVIGLLLPGIRLDRGDWHGIGRVVAVSLPILLVMASAQPSEPDTFLNLLPNAAYLYDHSVFPALGRSDAHSFLPGAPYNLQLTGFIAALALPQFPPSALIGFNVVLQLAAGLLLSRLAGGTEDSAAAPSWTLAAFGVLLATAFNPGFVPRYDFSSYSEPSVMVMLAFAGYLAAKREGGTTAWLLALTLAALVNIKQDSVALVTGIVVTAALLPLRSGERRAGVVARGVAIAVPAALLYLAWRWYVVAGLPPSAELKPLPFAAWQFTALPAVLRQILGIMGEKIFFFGVLGATLLAFLLRRRRVAGGLAMNAAALLFGITLLYNAALLVAYVAHFSGQMAADAHSYFRYNTHLALLLMVALTLMARDHVALRLARLPRQWRRRLPAVAIALVLACPLIFIAFLRFDLEAPEIRAAYLARQIAERIGDRDRVALILPGDNQSLGAALETLLRVMPPRRNDLTLGYEPGLATDTLDRLGKAGYRWAVLSCAPTGLPDAPAGEGALLAHGDSGWQVTAHWRYPPAHGHWSQVIAPAPLCL